MICPQCNRNFTKSHHSQRYCSKECSKEVIKEYIKKYQKLDKGKAARTKAQKKYRSKDKIKARIKEYHQKPEIKEVKKENRKKWLKTEKGKEYLKKMFSPEKKALYNAKYRTTQKGKEANRKGVKKAVKNNPIYKMSMNVRHRLNEFLNLKRLTKKNKTFEMVGCTPGELKIYLEKKFKPGMTWWNHSPKGWHIDHRIPLASAKNYEDIVRLMHYTNLQPMWAPENIKKSNKII
jgi:hypothetical protein